MKRERHSLRILLVLLLAMTVCGQAYATQLTIWHNWSPPRDVLLTEILSSYTAKNPSIEISHMYYNTQEIKEKYILSVGSGAAPDIIMLHDLDVHAFKDTLLPLDGLMARDQIDLSQWYHTEVEAGIVDGVRYGLPMRTGGDAGSLFYYNRTHFNEVGMDPMRPPDTWDELAEAMRRLNIYGPDGNLMRPSINMRWTGDFAAFGWIYNGGGRVYDEDGRTMRLTSSESMDAINTVTGMVQAAFRTPTDSVTDLGTGEFFQGQVSMYISGSAVWLSHNPENQDYEFAMSLRPRRPGVDNRGLYGWSFVYGIHEGTPNAEEAWRLVRFLTMEKDGVGEFMIRQGRPSPIRAHNSDPRYFDINPFFHLVGEALANVVAMPKYPFTRDVELLLRDEFIEILQGQKPVGNTMDNIERLAQGIVDRYWASQ